VREVELKKGGDRYCVFQLLENGKPQTRRFPEVVVQDAEGVVHRLTGDELPLYIGGYTGESHTGHHTLEILLRPKKLKRTPEPQAEGYRWPVGRDVLHVAIGFLGLQLLRATFFGIDAFLNTLVGAFYEALSH
jgi:hypothetical protein